VDIECELDNNMNFSRLSDSVSTLMSRKLRVNTGNAIGFCILKKSMTCIYTKTYFMTLSFSRPIK